MRVRDREVLFPRGGEALLEARPNGLPDVLPDLDAFFSAARWVEWSWTSGCPVRVARLHPTVSAVSRAHGRLLCHPLIWNDKNIRKIIV